MAHKTIDPRQEVVNIKMAKDAFVSDLDSLRTEAACEVYKLQALIELSLGWACSTKENIGEKDWASLIAIFEDMTAKLAEQLDAIEALAQAYQRDAN